MIDAWLTTLEAAPFSHALRGSVWVYPLVNAAHVLGVALLLGAIIPLDLRLLGVWRTVPLAPLWQVLTRSAAVGLALAAMFGTLLLVARATEYAASSLFVAKMGLIVLATANALALRAAGVEGMLGAADTARKLPVRVRLGAAISLTAWLSVLTLGRLVGYS